MSESVYVLEEDLISSRRIRFLNYLIDYIFTYAASTVLGLIVPELVKVLDSVGLTGFGFWIFNAGSWTIIFLSVLMITAYYVVAEGVFGSTVGKFITGTVVVDENGNKPGWGIILKRSLCRLIPFEIFSFLGSPSRGWHDSISNTYVVNKKDLENEVKLFHEFNLIGNTELN